METNQLVADRRITELTPLLGVSGAAALNDLCSTTFGVPLVELPAERLSELLHLLERPPLLAGASDEVAALTESLYLLQAALYGGLSALLVEALEGHIGPVAAPLLENACAGLNLEPDQIQREPLLDLAQIIELDVELILGNEKARAAVNAMPTVGGSSPPVPEAEVRALLQQHLGDDGAELLSIIRPRHPEIPAEILDGDGIGLLARAVEHEGAELFSAIRADRFITAARALIPRPAELAPSLTPPSAPAPDITHPVIAETPRPSDAAGQVAPASRAELDGLHVAIIEVLEGVIGLAAEPFLREACMRRGRPFEALSSGHLVWLCETLAGGLVKLAGERAAGATLRRLMMLPDDHPQ